MKTHAYEAALQNIRATLGEETNNLAKMTTIACLLKEQLPYYFWVGFYCVHEEELLIGPYQGSLGCLRIPFDKGVCGKAARERQTQVVADVHQVPDHIACDARSQSEIVVPVIDKDGNLIAVLDVDSTLIGAFDETDQHYLEALVQEHFGQGEVEMGYQT